MRLFASIILALGLATAPALAETPATPAAAETVALADFSGDWVVTTTNDVEIPFNFIQRGNRIQGIGPVGGSSAMIVSGTIVGNVVEINWQVRDGMGQANFMGTGTLTMNEAGDGFAGTLVVGTGEDFPGNGWTAVRP